MSKHHGAIDPDTARALIALGASVHAINRDGAAPPLAAAHRNRHNHNLRAVSGSSN